MESTLRDGGCVGASVMVQQLGESSDRLLSRARKSAHALRTAGCRITGVTFVLGVHEGLKSRLDVALGLLDLLADDACALHLVTSTESSQQALLFQLVEQLLSGRKQQHPIHMSFHERKLDQNVLKARAQRPASPILTALDLTG